MGINFTTIFYNNLNLYTSRYKDEYKRLLDFASVHNRIYFVYYIASHKTEVRQDIFLATNTWKLAQKKNFLTNISQNSYWLSHLWIIWKMVKKIYCNYLNKRRTIYSEVVQEMKLFLKIFWNKHQIILRSH